MTPINWCNYCALTFFIEAVFRCSHAGCSEARRFLALDRMSPMELFKLCRGFNELQHLYNSAIANLLVQRLKCSLWK